jgi:hypothetical protein
MMRAMNTTTSNLNNLAQRNLTCLMGAILALCVAQFNRAVKARLEVAPLSARSVRALEAEVLTREKEIWEALKRQDLAGASREAKELADRAALLLSKTVDQAAAIARLRKDAPNSGKNDVMAIETGNLIRKLLLAIALGRWVTWLAAWGGREKMLQQWQQAAARRKFRSEHKVPPRVPVAALLANGGGFDGKVVSLRGVLGPVTITHRGKKVVSRAPLFLSNGRSVELILPHIKLDSGGLVPGASAEIAGTWRLKSTEAKGPALQIQRRKLGEESRSSWLAWVEASLQHFIEVVPHQLVATWSWEPGPNGAGNSLLYGTFFAK